MKYNIVAYGSLMSHKSMRETIPKNRHFIPVIVKGYKRVFNIALETSKNSDILNLKKSPKSKFNGLLFHVNAAELRKIKKREAEYNLEQAWAYDFETGKRLEKCFFVIDYLVSIDKKQRKPSKNYFILCREAAYNISKKFGRYWDQTTYTSRGEKISNWIKRNKRYDTIR